jgi:hypothetical protein
MAETYDIGDAPTLIATFTDEAGGLADPTEVIFRYKDPEGTLVELQHWTAAAPGTDITKVSTGKFSARVPITKSGGYYAWHWLGTGAVQAAKESDPDTALKVRTSGFPAVP